MDTNTDSPQNSDNINSNHQDEEQANPEQAPETPTQAIEESQSDSGNIQPDGEAPETPTEDNSEESSQDNNVAPPDSEAAESTVGDSSAEDEKQEEPADVNEDKPAENEAAESPVENSNTEDEKPDESASEGDSGPKADYQPSVSSSEASSEVNDDNASNAPGEATDTKPVNDSSSSAGSVADTVPEPAQAPTVPEAASESPAPTTVQPKEAKKLPLMLLIVFIVGLAAIGGGGYLYYRHKHDAPKPVSNLKVGLMMAFSGGSSAMGFGTSKGVALAKKQLNADNITVVEADSQCDPIAAVKAIHQLIKDHVVAIIGDGCSSASLAALPIANNAQIPMISPSASSTKLSIPNDYFYRVIPNDNHQGAFMANTVYNDGIRKVGVFYTNEPYGASIEQAFQNSFESLGGKVVATAFSQPNVIDLSSQINTLKAANPQAIFFAPNSVLTGIAAVKLARQAGVTVPFYGADVFYDQTIISNAASDVEGMTFTTFPTGTTAFKQALANAYPNASQLYAAPEAYDAFKAIYIAIQKGATTGPEIKSTLPSIKFQGVSSYISFDANGDLATPNGYQYALFQVKNGQFVQLN